MAEQLVGKQRRLRQERSGTRMRVLQFGLTVKRVCAALEHEQQMPYPDAKVRGEREREREREMYN